MTKIVTIHEMSAMEGPARNRLLLAENAGFIIRALSDHHSKRRIYLHLKAHCGFAMSYSWFMRLCRRLLPLYGYGRLSETTVRPEASVAGDSRMPGGSDGVLI